ncbi:nuclear transcription factor Y subunit C-3-like [Mercurialis annua]|uniref:nuclear transcription factor Y subunit C-3-like n=1 Tax=Mercurialis annua TaxID=3986 RepID=UPI0021608160|nr:nuclear transcription factor Y subunit C-3-like [Mercurialis annua]
MRQAGTYSGLLLSGRSGPHCLPLARIKKIMKKSGDDVKMISGEAPIVFAKACELFIEELTKKSWMVTMQSKRRTLHKDDVVSAVIATDIFDFLFSLLDHHSIDDDPPLSDVK